MALSLPPHNILSPFHLDALTASVVRGDIIIGNATPKWARLAAPGALSGLSHDGTDVSWVTVTGTGAPVRANSPAITGSPTITQSVTATGAIKVLVVTDAINTNQTASTEIPTINFALTGRQWATGAITTQREVLFAQPTYTFVGASTITDAATVAIAGAPIKSTNASITNTHGLLIQAGAVSTATNSYGLTVNAQTGATNNYAAQFLGGNVFLAETNRKVFLSATNGMNLYANSVSSLRIASLNNDLVQLQSGGQFDLLGSSARLGLDASNGCNILLDTTTGTKIGTTTSQKLGFWNVTPIIQPAGAGQVAYTDSTGGTPAASLVDVGVVFSEANINNNFATIAVLQLAMRTALVNAGLMKGAA